MDNEYQRTGSFRVNFSKEEIFPLLCPKMEEKWIPGWKCEVLESKSGYNELKAKFNTQNAFGIELIWNTRIYNKERGIIEFENVAENVLNFVFLIHIHQVSNKLCQLTFTHTFTALNNKGNDLIKNYSNENFQLKLDGLAQLMESYLTKKQL